MNPKRLPPPVCYDRPIAIDAICEDQVSALILRITRTIYDPLSPVERQRVYLASLLQGRYAQEYKRVTGTAL